MSDVRTTREVEIDGITGSEKRVDRSVNIFFEATRIFRIPSGTDASDSHSRIGLPPYAISLAAASLR
jgi:hypothetical protein